MLDSHVLVLNRVFQAVQVTSVRKAFTLFYKGHVRAVLPDYSTWDFDNWCDIPVQPHDEVVLTPSSAIRIPRVVALKEFDRLPRSGQTMYGFALGVYPTDQPTLPGAGD